MATEEDWREALDGCSVVVHLAGPVPIDADNVVDKDKELTQPLVEGARVLLRACAAERSREGSQLRRFVLGGVCTNVAGNVLPDFSRVWSEADWTDLSADVGEFEEVKVKQERLVTEFIEAMPGEWCQQVASGQGGCLLEISTKKRVLV